MSNVHTHRVRVSLMLAPLLLFSVTASGFGGKGHHDGPGESGFGWGHHHRGDGFVKRFGPRLWLNGEPFRFAGTNNYYLMYKSRFMVDDVLETADEAGFDVIRMWGSLDIGNEDFSNSIHTNEEGVYFHYWDPGAGAPGRRPLTTARAGWNAWTTSWPGRASWA